MKIVFVGTKPSDKVYSFTCKCCKSIVEEVGKHCKVAENDYGVTYVQIEKCPVCGSWDNGMITSVVNCYFD